MRIRQRDIDGTPLRWAEAGDGHAVVLIHGIPTNPSLWRHVLPLVGDARLLAFEMTGYGDSIPAGRDRDISVSAQADRLVRWLEELEIDRAVLVGHDLGGGVAQIAAVRRPERCAGLVLTNSIGYDSWPIPSVKAMRSVEGVIARLPAPAIAPVFAALLPRGHDDLRVARESFRHHYQPYAESDGGAGLARQVAALDVNDTLAVADRLPGLDVPARIVWGADDQFQPIDYGERLAADIDADLRPIPGGKHFTPEDHPDAVAAAITDVLREAA